MQSLLYLVHRIPYPPNKGDKVRSYHVLKYLVSRYKVYLGAFVDDAADLVHADVLKALCQEVHLVRLRPTLAKLRSMTGLVTGEPLTLPYYRDAGMRQWVDNSLRTQSIRSVLIFSAAMAQFVIACSGIRRVADLVDVDSDKWEQYAEKRIWPYSLIFRREGRKLLNYEREISRQFDSTVFVSAAEAGLFRRLAPESASSVRYINNGVDCDYFSPERDYDNPYAQDGQVLVFTGAMDYWPNVDAVVHFSNEVFPQILRANTAARFYIVGARPSPDVQKLGELPGITVTGSVPDIRPYLAHAKVAVAPLRIARGIQNKVLEAMAMSTPVVASPQAAEGIDAQDGREFMVAADENKFVELVLNLIRHDSATSIGAAGRARVLRDYSWESSLRQFEHLLATDTAPRDTAHTDVNKPLVEAGLSLPR